MVTKPTSTTQEWQEMELRADALVPANISDRIPVYLTERGRTVRINNSRITLPVLIGLYRSGDSVECLANECYPQLEQADVQAIVDYYNSADGSWIDQYIEILYNAADLRHADHKRRWEAGELGQRS